MDDELNIGLRPGVQTPFVRSVRDEAGELIQLLEFRPGVPVEIDSQEQFDAIENDIGNILMVIIQVDGTAKACRDTTRSLLVEIANRKEKAGLELAKFQREALEESRAMARSAESVEEPCDPWGEYSQELDDSSIESIDAELERLCGVLEVFDSESDAGDISTVKKLISVLRGKRTRLQNKLDSESSDDVESDDVESDDDSGE